MKRKNSETMLQEKASTSGVQTSELLRPPLWFHDESKCPDKSNHLSIKEKGNIKDYKFSMNRIPKTSWILHCRLVRVAHVTGEKKTHTPLVSPGRNKGEGHLTIMNLINLEININRNIEGKLPSFKTENSFTQLYCLIFKKKDPECTRNKSRVDYHINGNKP